MRATPSRSIAVDEVASGVVGELGDGVTIADEVTPDDDVVVAIGLLDLWGLGLFWEGVVLYASDAVSDVICRGVDISVDREFDGYFGLTVS